jgi:hypothetical protein
MLDGASHLHIVSARSNNVAASVARVDIIGATGAERRVT